MVLKSYQHKNKEPQFVREGFHAPLKKRKETRMKQAVPSPCGAALAGAALGPAAEGAAGAAGAQSQRTRY